MKIKVAELEGAKLDFFVAKAEGLNPVFRKEGKYPDGSEVYRDYVKAARIGMYSPSTDWAHGGPIIEREKIMLEPVETWCAHIYTGDPASNYATSKEGRTPLLAAMRCFVASRFGEEVEEA